MGTDTASTAPAIEPLASADFEEARRLIDRTMRPGESLSMAEDFPLLVGPAATSRRLVVREQGRIVAHAAGRVAAVSLPRGTTLRLINIGAVCTDPAHRGRGLARRLVGRVLEEAAADGVEAAILWSDVPALYAGLGFVHAGQETWFQVREPMLSASPRLPARAARPADVPRLADLRRRDPCPVWRTASEAEVLFALPRSRAFVLTRKDELVAYAVLGKGLDFPGMVCEWAGPAALLPSLLRELLPACGVGETIVVGPTWDLDFLATFESLACVRHDGDMAMMRVLRPDRVIAALPHLEPEAASGDPRALLWRVFGRAGGTPGGRGGLPLPFYVWGLDSM